MSKYQSIEDSLQLYEKNKFPVHVKLHYTSVARGVSRVSMNPAMKTNKHCLSQRSVCIVTVKV